jgi:hypothetical protein
MKVTIISNGIIKMNIDFLCIRSETSKFKYVPFFDFIYILKIKGTKTQPTIKNEIIDAFLKSSFANITKATKVGIVNNGWPIIDIKFAILDFILSIQKF